MRVSVGAPANDERRLGKSGVEPCDAGAVVIDVDAHGANPAVGIGGDLRARDGTRLWLRARACGEIIGG
jgi:hypothetical protein